MTGESATRVVLGPADVRDALALSDEAGWNQTADDWALFIAQGRVQGRRSAEGVLVATGAALAYGLGQGWISMVLVTPAWRHRGLASELLNDSVAWLRATGLTPVLDATPAGAQVYRRLGFMPGFAFERWESATVRALPGATAQGLRLATAADLDTLGALDAEAGRVDRRVLLQALLSRPGTRAWITAQRDGFVVVRQGRRAAQVGPLVATDERAALGLLQQVLDATAGAVFLDLPKRWSALAEALRQRGFRTQRPFVRMALGAAPALAGSERLFVVAGPEFG